MAEELAPLAERFPHWRGVLSTEGRTRAMCKLLELVLPLIEEWPENTFPREVLDARDELDKVWP
jgi:hypothetical protein